VAGPHNDKGRKPLRGPRRLLVVHRHARLKVGRGKDTIATQRTLFMMADAVFNDSKKLATLASFGGTALPRPVAKSHTLQP
jgi:hypothetical protein